MSHGPVESLCIAAKKAATELSQIPADRINQGLDTIAQQLHLRRDYILEANQKDLNKAHNKQLSPALVDRLRLDYPRIQSMIDGIYEIIKLDSPLNRELAQWQTPSGLSITRRSIPIGVIGLIYEARPNVTADGSALCLKSGNCIILRPGSDSFESSRAILQCIQQGLGKAGLPETLVQMLPSEDRANIDQLIKQDQYIDVIIPRGGHSLIQYLADKSRVPLLKHLAGVCHSYIHQDADPIKAIDVVFNAKMRRPGICGATETILVDQAILESHIPALLEKLLLADCELRGDSSICAINPAVKPASDDDWSSEYLAAIVSIKVVTSIEEAITHINRYSTDHTEAIITENPQAAEQFHQSINSAITMHNTSTQFADGGEFGMGAEIGIATGKLHARGPVGVEQLVTYKYEVSSEGLARP